MSTFPNDTAREIDDLVRANRARTPRAAVEQRKTPRYSIEEINNTDWDTIRDKYLTSRIDDRSPIVKVLDLVDLPRNVIANAIFRPAGLDTGKLRRGALGLPVISASDALGELGFKPGLTRAVLGFVGDVAIDPLTYVGPPGWGLRVASSAGREVAIGARGARDIRRAIEGVKAGRGISGSRETSALLEALTANAGQTFADAAKHAEYLSAKTLGSVKSPETILGKGADQFSRLLGGERKYEGGLLADALEPARFNEAGAQEARNLIAKYGKASAPGPSIGGRGSQVLHIPFTELSLNTAPISRAGRAALSDYNHAATRAARPIAETLPAFARVAAPVNDINNAVDSLASHFDETNKTVSDLDAQIKATNDPLVATALNDQLENYRGTRAAEVTAQLEANRTRLNELINHVEDAAKGVDPAKPESIADIMALHKLKEEATSKFAALESRMKAYPKYKEALDLSAIADNESEAVAESIQQAMTAWSLYHRSVDGAVGNFIRHSPEETTLIDAASKFLGTDERIIGRAAMSAPSSLIKHPGTLATAADLNGWMSRHVQNAFGVRNSALADGVRAYEHSMSAGKRRALTDLEHSIYREVTDAFTANGIKPTADIIDKTLMALRGYAYQAREANAGRELFYAHKFVPGRAFDSAKEPAKWVTDMQELVNAGVFGKAGGDTLQRLKGIAQKWGVDFLDSMNDVANKTGIETLSRADYFPHTGTEAASKAIARGAKYADKDRPAVSALNRQASESFQKPRSFDQVRWKGLDGTEKRIFRADEDFAKRLIADPTDILRLEAEGRKDVADELRQLVADYQDYLQSDQVGKWHGTDPGEMNELLKLGRFGILTDGADLPGGFMHTNFLAAIAGRLGSHHTAVANAGFDKIRQLAAKPIDNAKFSQVAAGKDFVAKDGTVGKVVDVKSIDGTTDKGFKVGDTIYRRLRSDLRTDSKNPMIQMMGSKAADAVYPHEVVNAIERVAEKFQTPESVETMLRGYDTIIRHWKSLTLFHPAWMIFNMIGDVGNGISDGLNLRRFFDHKQVRDAMTVTRHFDDPEKIAKLSFDINGQTMSGADLADHIVREGVIDGTRLAETAGQLFLNGHATLPSSVMSGRFANLRRDALKSDYIATLDAMTLGRKAENLDKIKAGATVISDRIASNFIAPWFRINQKASNFVRTNMFLSYLRDGYDVKSAARKVINSQFDYANATLVERDVFRRMFPFYSWMRNNGAYQIKKLFESPVYAAAYPKVQAAIEEAIAADDRVPLQQRPNWMRQQLALQIGKDPDHRFALMFGGGLPVGDVYQLLTPVLGPAGVQDFLRYFVSATNPVAGAAIDLGTGRERFSGRTIGVEGDMTAGEYLRNQVRPLAEVGKIGKAFEKGAAQGVGRALLGGRVQDFSQERVHSTKLREYKDRETNIRRKISKAERDGDKSTSVFMRARLLKLYDLMAENGFENETPKWARRQLESIKSGG